MVYRNQGPPALQQPNHVIMTMVTLIRTITSDTKMQPVSTGMKDTSPSSRLKVAQEVLEGAYYGLPNSE